MGGDYYARASGDAVFIVPKPNTSLGIGIDALPQSIRQSTVLTGNDLGILGNSTTVPDQLIPAADARLEELFQTHAHNEDELTYALHQYAHELLAAGRTDEAWAVLLSQGNR
jgi:hypothetical protein